MYRKVEEILNCEELFNKKSMPTEPIEKTRLRHTLHNLILDGLKIKDGEAILNAKAFERILGLFLKENRKWIKERKAFLEIIRKDQATITKLFKKK